MFHPSKDAKVEKVETRNLLQVIRNHFSCEEAALEVQSQVCLCLCVCVPKTEFLLSTFKCQPLTYLIL